MNFLTNKKGETHINTAIIIVIAVVVGALILGGLYMLFAGNNGVFDKLNDKIYDMSNTGGERSMKLEDGKLLYTYDEEEWVECELAELEETGRVTRYITIQNGETLIHLIAIQNTSRSLVCRSLDGKEWVPVKTTTSSIGLSSTNSGRGAYLSYFSVLIAKEYAFMTCVTHLLQWHYRRVWTLRPYPLR